MSNQMAKPDAVAVLISDHRHVDDLFKQFDLYDDTSAENLKHDLVRDITRELSIHAGIEEQVLYPAMRDALPDGEKEVQESLAEHQRVKETLAELERTDPNDPSFSAKVKALASAVISHVQEEENDLFPRLDAALGQQRMSELGQALEQAKKLAPTRPHPNAPDTFPANLANVAAGVVDRARDLVEEAIEKGREVVEGKSDGPGSGRQQ